MWVLIGEGPNDVEIPCLFWTDKDVALNFCKKLFEKEPDIHGDNFRWVADDYEISTSIGMVMYTSYYGGCGECYAATLKFVEEGKPFVCWSLD